MTTMTGQTGLAEALMRLSQLVAHVFADVSRGRDLTPQQAQLLCTLLEGPVGMTELGRLLHLEKSSLTGLVALGLREPPRGVPPGRTSLVGLVSRPKTTTPAPSPLLARA